MFINVYLYKYLYTYVILVVGYTVISKSKINYLGNLPYDQLIRLSR